MGGVTDDPGAISGGYLGVQPTELTQPQPSRNGPP